jgi:hypothetical protein
MAGTGFARTCLRCGFIATNSVSADTHRVNSHGGKPCYNPKAVPVEELAAWLRPLPEQRPRPEER